MRLQISFRPASREPNIVSATAEYEGLWAAHGDEIVARLEAHTGLHFAERELQAQIREEPSRSHPLQLRASYDPETKLGVLIHELAHRLSSMQRRRRADSRVTRSSISFSLRSGSISSGNHLHSVRSRSNPIGARSTPTRGARRRGWIERLAPRGCVPPSGPARSSLTADREIVESQPSGWPRTQTCSRP
jgi:hypothetical protein